MGMRWEVCEGKEYRVAARAQLAIALGIFMDLGVKWGLLKRWGKDAQSCCNPASFLHSSFPAQLQLCKILLGPTWTQRKSLVTRYGNLKKKFASKHKPMTVAMVCKHGIMASSHFFFPQFWVQSWAWQESVSDKNAWQQLASPGVWSWVGSQQEGVWEGSTAGLGINMSLGQTFHNWPWQCFFLQRAGAGLWGSRMNHCSSSIWQVPWFSSALHREEMMIQTERQKRSLAKGFWAGRGVWVPTHFLQVYSDS